MERDHASARPAASAGDGLLAELCGDDDQLLHDLSALDGDFTTTFSSSALDDLMATASRADLQRNRRRRAAVSRSRERKRMRGSPADGNRVNGSSVRRDSAVDPGASKTNGAEDSDGDGDGDGDGGDFGGTYHGGDVEDGGEGREEEDDDDHEGEEAEEAADDEDTEGEDEGGTAGDGSHAGMVLGDDTYPSSASPLSQIVLSPFGFTSDHAVLSESAEYHALLRTLVSLEAQLLTALRDIDTLAALRRRIVHHTIAFCRQLRDDPVSVMLPTRQRVVDVPHIDESLLVLHRPATRSAVRQLEEPLAVAGAAAAEAAGAAAASADATGSVPATPAGDMLIAGDVLAMLQSAAQKEHHEEDSDQKESAPAYAPAPTTEGMLLEERSAASSPMGTTQNGGNARPLGDVRLDPSKLSVGAQVAFRESMKLVAPAAAGMVASSHVPQASVEEGGEEDGPATRNLPWNEDEQQRLDELLIKYPENMFDRLVERWDIIARELGTRTRQQVWSRCQKYFLKLTKAGLPIPGRAVRMCMMMGSVTRERRILMS
jgi:hypothetical protein